MNRIEKLIAELCPDGVEWRKLGEVCGLITTGKLNANAMEENGIYPFFTCDEKPYRINTYAFDLEAILISGNGSKVGHLNYYKGKFNAYQRTYVLGLFSELIRPMFLFHFLKGHLKNYIFINSRKGSVPYITLPMLQNFPIPIPPLPIQEEIVKILDTFTELEAELELKLQAELEARKKQYEYYRNKLLTPVEHNGRWYLNGVEVEWKKLGEVGTLIRGSGLQKKDFIENGVDCIRYGQSGIYYGQGCIHYGQIYTYYRTFADRTISFVSETKAKKLKKAQKGDVLISGVSENIEDICKPIGWLGDEICISGDMFAFRHNQNTKYIIYYKLMISKTTRENMHKEQK
jgi:type I restriction enzyme S subunit